MRFFASTLLWSAALWAFLPAEPPLAAPDGRASDHFKHGFDGNGGFAVSAPRFESGYAIDLIFPEYFYLVQFLESATRGLKGSDPVSMISDPIRSGPISMISGKIRSDLIPMISNQIGSDLIPTISDPIQSDLISVISNPIGSDPISITSDPI